MKRTLLFISFVFSAVTLFSQTKTRPVVSDRYDRNSLSVILVEHNDSYDTEIRKAFTAIDPGEKFDINAIDHRFMTASWQRKVEDNGIAERRNSLSTALIRSNYGKLIVGYWFNRQPDGTMDAERVMYRGHYNATDMDRIKAEASKIGLASLADKGFGLVSNSYVLVVDYVNVEKELKDKKVTWTATAEAHLFKIHYDEETEYHLNESWIYDTDSEEVRREKIEKYNALQVPMVPVTSVSFTASGTDPDGLAKTVRSAYDGAVVKMENRVDQWNVASAIYGSKPIRAKIGTKEGVKNGKRFFVYEHRADRTGNVYSKKKGVVRATRVADNRGIATGDTKPSEFYQIAGGRLQEGMTLKQSNDLGLGLGIGYRVGAMTGFDVSLDLLAHITTKGNSQYVMMDFTVAGYGVNKYFEKNGLYRSGSGSSLPKVMNAYDFLLGYGYGMRVSRHVEFVPHAMIGFETLSVGDDEASVVLNSVTGEDDSFWDETALTGRFGLKLNANVKYPLQLFAALDYSFLFSKGETFRAYEEYLTLMDKERKGVGFTVGVKYTF